ncbi:SA1362 family protein [Bacillus massiliglaciei]|uniref:SA1362 family protein n=1 Tax=Bacillus massiliglaciei TaxID=1816693 RepID=UPI000DA5F359|nr:SA1362 family protein [Bacillus massiliglaciei]
MNRSLSYLMFGIITLGILGITMSLVSNPIGFFRNILIGAAVIGVIYMIYTRLTNAGPDKKEQRSFKKAARQSKKRHKSRSAKTKESNVASFSSAKSKKRPISRRKSDVQLTVIEGKKNKKRNRASF